MSIETVTQKAEQVVDEISSQTELIGSIETLLEEKYPGILNMSN